MIFFHTPFPPSSSAIEWISFEVLNIGLPVIDSIPVWPRITAALFQGLAARASGFAIVPIAETAPALQFLYVVMMYIAVSAFFSRFVLLVGHVVSANAVWNTC
jgi:Trk-type K+ transport system membrane component